ncbi:MAG: hypothetical protein H6Q66_2072 [Firmicutes bacterium]|nr:hypothetical protein [Bacillota bacterium]
MNTVAEVVNPLQKKFKDSLLPEAVRIYTPFSQKQPVAKLPMAAETKKFIEQYEPKAMSDGLFLHQYRLLDAYCQGADNFILTSSTGSGKSLCFWTWIMDTLLKKPVATALLCFPTQALMWSQAERLARVSRQDSLILRDKKTDIAYAGAVAAGKNEIAWTIWKGVGSGYTQDYCMIDHEKSSEFQRARIRLATLDKAHWSLIKGHPDFTKNLECLVLDEAHQYDGIFGANVAYFLKRIYVAKASASRKRPGIFLASATLADAPSFAAKLISLPEGQIHHEQDAAQAEITPIKAAEVETVLAQPPKDGLLRVAMFVDSLINESHFAEIVEEEKLLGNNLNLLYFADAKFGSRITKKDLDRCKNSRCAYVYDADLPPQKRREVENRFNKGLIKGATLIATSALEMGVDIENLDICLLQSVPAKRADLLQRIGRVGRRWNKPGLVLISLGSSPLDRYIAANPADAFHFDHARSIPIPMDLEIIRLRNIAAVQDELWKTGRHLHSPYCEKWNMYQQQLQVYFGEALNKSEVKEKLQQQYGSLIDLSDHKWTHNGFRASASQGKIPLRIQNTDNDDVAWIEDINVFRDAHPEAVYLDDRGRRWRVVEYDGKWKEAIWEHPDSEFVLAKYLKSIDVVYVREEPEQVATRGIWEESINPYQLFADPPKGVVFPKEGELEYGIWEYSRKFNGYRQISFSGKKTKKVSLSDVSARFKEAVNMGENFPFLFPLTYRTYGWSWDFGIAMASECGQKFLEDINNLVGGILEPFIADSIQSSSKDLQVDVSLVNGKIQIVDATPGGNGLSEGLLRVGGIPLALQNCIDVLTQFTRDKNQERYRSYVINLCQEEATHDAGEIIKIIHKLQSYWNG